MRELVVRFESDGILGKNSRALYQNLGRYNNNIILIWAEMPLHDQLRQFTDMPSFAGTI